MTPIYDRTQEDVDIANQILNEWIENSMSSMYQLKGCLNVSDINRIENNINYLTEVLDSLYYFSGATSKTWNELGIPNLTDVRRILNNIDKIITNYYEPLNAPDIPNSMTYYYEINAIEEILLRIKEMIESMEQVFQKSGMFKSGAMRFLPIRR